MTYCGLASIAAEDPIGIHAEHLHRVGQLREIALAEEPGAQPVAVDVARVTRGNVRVTVDASGRAIKVLQRLSDPVPGKTMPAMIVVDSPFDF